MLIRSEDMQRCFREKLEWADKIDLATAWATNNAGLRDLRECQGAGHIEIRAIVGLWSNITDPATLRALEEIGKLRIVDKSRFHPKIYIFRRKKEAVAWIGSANFTSGGFGMNEELMFETEDTRSIQEWFKNRWKKCGKLQPDAIDVYEHRRKQNPPPRFPQPDQASRIWIIHIDFFMTSPIGMAIGMDIDTPWRNVTNGGHLRDMAILFSGNHIVGIIPYRSCMTSSKGT